MNTTGYQGSELYTLLLNQLKKENDFIDDNGELKKWVVSDMARAYSPKVISILLADDVLKDKFFVDVNGTEVFKLDMFLRFLEQKTYLNDSYTCYANKIGIAIGDKQLMQYGDVELIFPYKDCVLEGGQSKEDVKRKEIFFNETLAQDEITQLLAPKVLTDGRRYTTDGETVCTSLNRDEEVNKKRGLSADTITDNLIIKGNNLLALHSIKKEFAGKVKLIYIDPPYYFTKNKAGDTFTYNSNFKLSTWLVFMKDRLKIAKDLLSKDGAILVHIGEDGMHWMKVLMEEIFGKENFVETFIWKNTDNPDSLSKKSRSSVEYIFCFEKAKDTSREFVGKESDNGDAPLLNSGNTEHELLFPKGSVRFNIEDGVYEPGKPERVELVTPVIVKNHLNENEIKLKGEFKWSQATLDEEIEKETYFIVKTNKFSVRFQRKEASTMAPEKYIDEQYLSKSIGVGTNEDASTHINNLGLDFSFSKPESIVAFFLRAITRENDIVLDFFLGSGTTAAVAHKMNRQYIGIEQIDHQIIQCLKRMPQVIGKKKTTKEGLFNELDYDTGGISESVGWQGGGEFVYLELKRYNQQFLDEIAEAETTDALLDIWNQMKEKAFFRFNVEMQELENSMEEFKEFSIEEQKKTLCNLLDMNQLYVNRSEMDDTQYQTTDEERALTESFYKR